MARWRFCNVLQSGSDIRNLWQFSASGKFNLNKHETRLGKEKLPEKLIARDWQTLFQPRLDVAWLSSHKVFLRVIQLPKADLAETQSMIDLQLEKLSPVPVAQVVWGFELLPTAEPDMQTAVVMIVPRSEVDAYLGSLEAQGFTADRLELAFIDQLRATKPHEDGAWIFPAGSGVTDSCLVAWWYHGTLRNLSIVHLPMIGDKAAALQHQLAQMTWAGELEGWLTSPPRYHLVADPETAELWRNFFSPEHPLEIASSIGPGELAALTARRAVAGEPRTNLLPPEYAARYKQQFVDRLWMRSLGAVLVVYILLAGAYIGWVQFAKWRYTSVESQVAALGPTYTNVIQIKDRVRIMQEQIALQYAALECYRALAETLPAELTLDTMYFDRGRKLTVSGSAAEPDRLKVIEFNEQLMRVRSGDQLLFSQVDPPQHNSGPNNQIRWRFTCDLKRFDIE
jgi:hypothetical protein